MIETLWEWNLWFWRLEAFGLILAAIVYWSLVAPPRWYEWGPAPPIGQKCDATLANLKKAEAVLHSAIQEDLAKVRKGMMVTLPEGASVMYSVDGRPRVIVRPTQKTWR